MTILLSLRRMMKQMFAAFAFTQSITHSLIWMIVVACELLSENVHTYIYIYLSGEMMHGESVDALGHGKTGRGEALSEC